VTQAAAALPEPLAPPSILEARHDDVVVKARLQVPGITIELCNFPAVRGEETVSCEADTVLSLNLSPLLPNSSGRYRTSAYSRFTAFGQMHMRPAGIPLEFRYAGGGFRSVRCRFDAKEGEILGDMSDWGPVELDACLDIRDPRIENALLRLAEECERPGVGSDTLVAGLGATILVDLMRYFQSVRDRASVRLGGLSAVHLRRIMSCIDARVEPPRISELAELCGLSRSHLMRAFRQSTGQSIAKYVEGVRITKAKALLAESDRPIGDVARLLGFPSAAAFSHVFRRATGRTPREYRLRVG